MTSAFGIGVATEIPVFIDAAGQALFGILTTPTEGAAETAVIHVRGGSQVPSSGRNRTSVRLCRRLAQAGYHAFRFDYRGVGESTGTVERFRHDDPFTSDVEACVTWLRTRGFSRFVLIGECFGARTALACGGLQGLEALVLLGTPVRDASKTKGGTKALVRHRSLLGYVGHALRPRLIRMLGSRRGRQRYARAVRATLQAAPTPRGSVTGPGWVSERLLMEVDGVLGRGIPVLFMNGREDPGFGDLVRAKSGRLGELARGAGSLVRFEVLDGRLAACADADLQEPAIEVITGWLVESQSQPSVVSR